MVANKRQFWGGYALVVASTLFTVAAGQNCTPACVEQGPCLAEINTALGLGESGVSWAGCPCATPSTASWDGITCEDCYVTEIQLASRQLNGTVAACVWSLGLTDFDLSNNNLEGTIPGPHDNSSQLASLKLSGNSIQGHLPDLVNATKLTHIEVNSNLISGWIPSSSQHAGLVLGEFLASDNALSGVVPEWMFQGSLYQIALESNRLSGTIPSAVGVLLESLDLTGNQISGFIPAPLLGINTSTGSLLSNLFLGSNRLSGTIGSMEALDELSAFKAPSNELSGHIPNMCGHSLLGAVELDSNSLSGTLPHCLFQSLPGLYALRLKDNLLSGDLPTNITAPLEELDLSNNVISGSIPSGFCSQVQSIETLHVANNKMVGFLPTGPCANLFSLRAHANFLSGHIPESLRDAPLRIITINSNSISGTIPEFSSADFNAIYFFQNQISGTVPASVVRLPNMALLVGQDNALSGTLPSIGSSFELLMLQNNRISGSIAPDLCLSIWGAPNLLGLAIDGNSISGDLAPFRQCSRLRLLQAADNKLSGEIEPLSNLTKLEILHLDGNSKVGGALPRSLPQLTQMLAGFTNIEGTIPQHLHQSISIWSTHNTRISGTIPTALVSKTKLQLLTFHNTLVGGALPGPLFNSTVLESVHGHNARLSCRVPPAPRSNNLTKSGTILMGNRMSGSDASDIPLWVHPSTRENQLLYSSEDGVFKRTATILWTSSVVFVVVMACICIGIEVSPCKMYKEWTSAPWVDADFYLFFKTHKAMTRYLALCMLFSVGPLIAIYAQSNKFYDCGSVLVGLSMAYINDPQMEFGLAVFLSVYVAFVGLISFRFFVRLHRPLSAAERTARRHHADSNVAQLILAEGLTAGNRPVLPRTKGHARDASLPGLTDSKRDSKRSDHQATGAVQSQRRPGLLALLFRDCKSLSVYAGWALIFSLMLIPQIVYILVFSLPSDNVFGIRADLATGYALVVADLAVRAFFLAPLARWYARRIGKKGAAPRIILFSYLLRLLVPLLVLVILDQGCFQGYMAFWSACRDPSSFRITKTVSLDFIRVAIGLDASFDFGQTTKVILTTEQVCKLGFQGGTCSRRIVDVFGTFVLSSWALRVFATPLVKLGTNLLASRISTIFRYKLPTVRPSYELAALLGTFIDLLTFGPFLPLLFPLGLVYLLTNALSINLFLRLGRWRDSKKVFYGPKSQVLGAAFLAPLLLTLFFVEADLNGKGLLSACASLTFVASFAAAYYVRQDSTRCSKVESAFTVAEKTFARCVFSSCWLDDAERQTETIKMSVLPANRVLKNLVSTTDKAGTELDALFRQSSRGMGSSRRSSTETKRNHVVRTVSRQVTNRSTSFGSSGSRIASVDTVPAGVRRQRGALERSNSRLLETFEV